jgi:O-antigen biosynthesis protein
MLDSRKLIVIMGPHRSGTSLCTAALECLGAELRLPTRYANEENRKGFFEHPDIVEFNDSLLKHLGGTWDNPLFDGSKAVATTDISDWLTRAAELFDSIYSDAKIAAIKDPRFCQLLDFWMQVFIACGYSDEEIFVIHVLREPVEVALSQQQRAKYNPAYYEIGARLVEGAALWLSLTGQALLQTRNLQNCFITYPALLSNPELVLQKLARFLALTPDQKQVGNFCDYFVDPTLHRSVSAQEETELLAGEFPQVIEFNRELQLLGLDGSSIPDAVDRALQVYLNPGTQLAMAIAMAPAISRLSGRSRQDSLEVEHKADVIADLKKQADEYASVISPLRTQISQLEQGIGDLASQLDAQSNEVLRLESVIHEFQDTNAGLERVVHNLEHTIGQIQASTSWKLTKPLRKLGTFRRSLPKRIRELTARFRLQSIYRYQRMSVRHPRLAWTCRIALRPFFRLMHSFLQRDDERYATNSIGGLLRPMLYQQTESSKDYLPLVSIIVPNFNHAAFLPLRLDSIYSQSYQNFEVILLDDSSTDNSHEVLSGYKSTHPKNTTLLVNEENSGGVFHQWSKGLALAKGEIIWIAESDDWCSENFLETLIPYFQNEAVQLAYCRTVFMDASGSQAQWSINEYLHDIDPDRWTGQILETAKNIVADAFAIKNIIPNVSSAIFRNPGSLELLRDEKWKEMQICGDWIFYLHLIRGGVLAYSPNACNYYRIHGKNTSVKTYSQDVYYLEHEMVAKVVQKYYRVDAAAFRRQKEILIAHWRESRPFYSDSAFEACYSLSRIAAAASEREPNLLMASYAFCTGGGETFPVELANLMKAVGYNVTFLDCAQAPRNEGVRKNLRSDIPVVSDFTQLERIVADFGIDFIHSHHAWLDGTILDLLPESSDCKLIVTLHGMYETISNVDLKFILPRLVKRSARLVYVAEKNLSALAAHNLLEKARVVHIENALTATPFEKICRSDLNIPDEAFVLTLVSRAMKEKGWQEAIEIVTAARKDSGRDIHLVLVGDGAEHDRLAKLQLPAFVHLKGFQRNVRAYFAVADFGLLPSKFLGESSPLVIIECLQAGSPVLASALGDISYMLSSPDGTAGIMVELNGGKIDIDLWAREIATLASDKHACEILSSRVHRAAQKFDAKIMTTKYDNVYRSVWSESEQSIISSSSGRSVANNCVTLA